MWPEAKIYHMLKHHNKPCRILHITCGIHAWMQLTFIVFPYPSQWIAVELPRDRRNVASLFFLDCTAAVERRHAGGGGAAAIPLQIGPTPGDSAEDLNMFKVLAVPPRRSAVWTVFGGATAINDGTTAEPRRSWRCHCGLCRTSTAVATRLRCDGGIWPLLLCSQRLWWNFHRWCQSR